MVKFQVVLSFQCLLSPLILTISFSLSFQNSAYPWRLLLRIFSGCVCSEYQSCDSLWGIPGCPSHLAVGYVAVLRAWAFCPPGTSSKSTSWSCQSSRPLWTLSDADSLKLFRGEKTGSLPSLMAVRAVNMATFTCAFHPASRTNTLLTHLLGEKSSSAA